MLTGGSTGIPYIPYFRIFRVFRHSVLSVRQCAIPPNMVTVGHPYVAHFQECHRNREKKLGVYMVWGDAVTKLQTFVWIFNHASRIIT